MWFDFVPGSGALGVICALPEVSASALGACECMSDVGSAELGEPFTGGGDVGGVEFGESA